MVQEAPEITHPGSPTLPDAPRVRTVACVGGVSLERDVPCEQLREYVREPDNLIWVDVQDPGPEELSMLLEEFGFHPLALEEMATGRQRPKVDEYPGYMFVVSYGVGAQGVGPGIQPVEIDLFAGRNYVVSIHQGRVPALDEAFGRWTRSGSMLREGVGFLLYTLLDAIIESYSPVLATIEDRLDEAEIAMFARFPETAVQDLMELKRALFALRRVLYPMRDTYSIFLRRSQPLFAPESLIYLQDVYNHILRILDVLDIERDRAGGVLEAYLAVTSNRLNTVMRTLTVVSVTLGLAGCVFGIWGMNVADIPRFFTAPAFWGVLCGTVALCAGVFLVSRMRGWL